MTVKKVVAPPRQRIRKTVANLSSYMNGQELYNTLLDIKKTVDNLMDVTIEIQESYGHSHELVFSTSRLETDAEFAARLKKHEDAERKQFEALKRKFERVPGAPDAVLIIEDNSGKPDKSGPVDG